MPSNLLPKLHPVSAFLDGVQRCCQSAVKSYDRGPNPCNLYTCSLRKKNPRREGVTPQSSFYVHPLMGKQFRNSSTLCLVKKSITISGVEASPVSFFPAFALLKWKEWRASREELVLLCLTLHRV
ncbi:unnamed protein product [Ixodes pacificus]